MAKDKKKASLNPDDHVEGGGLIDDVNATVNSARFELWDYNGKIPNAVPALKLELETEEGEEVEQYFSMGSGDDWEPSDDGTGLEAIGKASAIRTTTNGGIFLKALMDAGFPADDLGDDISCLDGLQAHFVQVPAPARPGLVKKERADGKTFEQTILIVSEIVAMPGEKKKPKGSPKKAKPKAKAKGKAKAEPEEESGDDLTENAQAVIMAVLADEDYAPEGTISRKKLVTAIFKAAKEDPDRNAIVKLVMDDEFMEDGPWELDGKEVSLG